VLVALTDEPAATIKAFPSLAKMDSPVLVDAAPVFRQYGIESLPHTVLFNAQGQVVEDFSGFDPGALDRVERHLQASRPAGSSGDRVRGARPAPRVARAGVVW